MQGFFFPNNYNLWFEWYAYLWLDTVHTQALKPVTSKAVHDGWITFVRHSTISTALHAIFIGDKEGIV